jgi:hypothetical protein
MNSGSTISELSDTPSEIMVTRVFKVAEIISRERRQEQRNVLSSENGSKNPIDMEIEYRQTTGHLHQT